ncbi:Zinc finger LIM-type, partial [Trinorchestia longiramus]
PPQPAHSYTPTSKAAVRMGAPQPLYSNTLKSATTMGPQHYETQHRGLYSNIPSHDGDDLRNYHYQAQQCYANVNPSQRGVQYASYGVDQDFPLPPPEVLSECRGAASPVSSAYSELRRSSHQAPGNTARPHQHYAPPSVSAVCYSSVGCGREWLCACTAFLARRRHKLWQPASGGYESLYEPISPRPPSQMSTRSAGAPLAGYGSSSNYAGRIASQGGGAGGTGKEAEVDALTNLLVQSMESSSDPEFFGICARCGGKVVGEGSGCTAMEQVFHIRCFDCIVCHLQLQGKPFYAVDSKPYCEQCYVVSAYPLSLSLFVSGHKQMVHSSQNIPALMCLIL